MFSRDIAPKTVGGNGRARAGLHWGIKSSFLDYLTRTPGSQSSVTSGALITSKRRYYFPLATTGYDPLDGEGILKFSGDVRFVGHFGMLLVVFIDPWVTMDGAGGTLTVADPDHYPDSTRRLPMLDLAEADWKDNQGMRHWPSIATTLRPEAMAFFNDVYPAGEVFDPVDIWIEV